MQVEFVARICLPVSREKCWRKVGSGGVAGLGDKFGTGILDPL